MKFPRDVYAITNTVTGRIYIGSTSNIEERFRSHINALRRGNHPNRDMQSDYDEYGDHFRFTIVDHVSSYEQRVKECEWMDRLHTGVRQIGYNFNDPHYTSRGRRKRVKSEWKPLHR